MSIEQKRAAVAKAYPGDRWTQRVRNMRDAQVHTVYMQLLNSNKLPKS